MKQQRQIDVKHFESTQGFIYRYQKLIKEVVIPYQYAVLHDQVEGVEKSHVVANFENAAKAVRGEDIGTAFTEWYFRTVMLLNGLKLWPTVLLIFRMLIWKQRLTA